MGGGQLSRFLEHFAVQMGVHVTILPKSACDLTELNHVKRVFESFNHDVNLIITGAITRLHGDSISIFNKNINMISNIVSSVNPYVKHVVFFSSVDVYGLNPMCPITEENCVKPFDYYGLSKQVNEFSIHQKFLEQGIPWTIFRLSGLYGDKHCPMGVISKMCYSAKTKNIISVDNTDMIERDLVYAGDVPYFVWKSIENSNCGIFNLATGQSFTLEGIADEIMKIFPKCKLEKRDTDSNERPGILRFSNSKLLNAFKNFKFTDLREGVHLQ